MTLLERQRQLRHRSFARDLAWLVYSLRQMPGGRELLEDKKRQLQEAGVLKKGDNDDHLQRHE